MNSRAPFAGRHVPAHLSASASTIGTHPSAPAHAPKRARTLTHLQLHHRRPPAPRRPHFLHCAQEHPPVPRRPAAHQPLVAHALQEAGGQAAAGPVLATRKHLWGQVRRTGVVWADIQARSAHDILLEQNSTERFALTQIPGSSRTLLQPSTRTAPPPCRNSLPALRPLATPPGPTHPHVHVPPLAPPSPPTITTTSCICSSPSLSHLLQFPPPSYWYISSHIGIILLRLSGHP